ASHIYVHALRAFSQRAAVAVRVVGACLRELGILEIRLAQARRLGPDALTIRIRISRAVAVVGTAGELVFSVLVIVGFAGRLSAIGLFAVNALAVISYAHVLFQEGSAAGLGQHYLWGFMLLVIVIYGPGALSIDGLLARRSGYVTRDSY